MSLLRAAKLTADLAQRRADLIRLFGEPKYLEHVRAAKDRINEAMAVREDTNVFSAAIAVCNAMKEANPGRDVSTAQQFVLAAAADIAENRI